MATYVSPSMMRSTAPTSSAVNPAPQEGRGAYGKVPGALSLPNPYADLSSVYPNLGPTNAAVSGNVLSELQGQVSPETMNTIRNAAATFGVNAGMPGSQFASYKGLRDLGLTSEAIRRQGLQDYASIAPTISQTQTVNPALQTQIAETNALNAAAPDPQLAAEEQQRLFDEYLNKVMSPAGGTSNLVDQDISSQLGPGTVKTGPNTYRTPYWAGF